MRKELNENLTSFKIRQIMNDKGWDSRDSFFKISDGTHCYKILFKKILSNSKIISVEKETTDIYEIDKLTYDVATDCLNQESEYLNSKQREEDFEKSYPKPPFGWSKTGKSTIFSKRTTPPVTVESKPKKSTDWSNTGKSVIFRKETTPPVPVESKPEDTTDLGGSKSVIFRKSFEKGESIPIPPTIETPVYENESVGEVIPDYIPSGYVRNPFGGIEPEPIPVSPEPVIVEPTENIGESIPMDLTNYNPFSF